MAEQAISCPSCGKKIPLTRALRAEIESSVREQYEEASISGSASCDPRSPALKADLERAATEAAKAAEKKASQELPS